jgi:hypothetical protein
VNQTSHIILLGTTSPVLASIRIFPNNEPVDVTRLLIYMGTIESIDALEVYRADGAYLGRATLDSTEGGYVLRIGSHLLQIDRRTSESVYVRAIVNAENNGGWSGETVLVDHIAVEANGIWSNTTYGFSTSDYFPESVTARARITLVENDGSTTETLIPGTQQIVGEFRIAGAATDSEAGVMIQTLAFQVSRTSEVTLSNVVLGASDTNTTSACSLTNDLVTCASIPAALGDIDDGERRFRLYGDVALASSNQAVLQLILNDAGSPSSSGSITWNDTEAIFIWVDRASSPLARGTLYTR